MAADPGRAVYRFGTWKRATVHRVTSSSGSSPTAGVSGSARLVTYMCSPTINFLMGFLHFVIHQARIFLPPGGGCQLPRESDGVTHARLCRDPETPAVTAAGPGSCKDHAYVDRVAEQNVHIAMKQIREKSPILQDLLASGAVRLIGEIYDVETGKVTIHRDSRLTLACVPWGQP
jgi:hypothetical protein